jgi:PAS domain S-box-containing protein
MRSAVERVLRHIPTTVRAWRRQGVPRGVSLALAGLLFVAILALWTGTAEAREGVSMLFVLPIALCAMAFGAPGGLLAGGLAIALVLGWNTGTHAHLGPIGVATRGVVFLLLGGMLGRFADVRERLAKRSRRYYELSRDLLCTANFDGYFEWVNPAWEDTLGYTRAELLARPFVEFVHPEERGDTEGEATRLIDDSAASHTFRNRYRTVDGSYRWLEWNTRVVAEERRFYAAARDITPQKEAEEALDNQAARLEVMVRERTMALEESRLETLQRLALAAEYRDDATHEHTERVGRNAALIALRLGLSEDTVALIRQAAPLHDIGKVGVPDTILLKLGGLTPEESAQMREHTNIGARILANPKFAILRMAESIALTHHERWDGSGYPQGLRGKEIPLSGRIVAVADVFDALTHERMYKPAWPLERAVAEIERHGGSHFEQRIVRAFAALDHERLLEPVARYDLELPSPPLVAARESPSADVKPSQVAEPVAFSPEARGRTG